MLELLAAVPFLVRRAAAVPRAREQHAAARQRARRRRRARWVRPSCCPAVAILPFMLYQLAGFGTLHFVVTKPVNWIINIAILALIIAAYVANREGVYDRGKRYSSECWS